ncbi:MAG: tetratricopeptide repeat protein [Bacteroidota bacterium]
MKRQFNIIPLITAGLLIMFFTQCANKFYRTGMDFYDAGNYEDAIEQYNQWLSEDPDNSKAYIARAEAYEKSDKKKEAADDYSKAGALKKDEDIFLKASDLYFEIENYERAAEMAKKATNEDKKNTEAHKKAIKSYIKFQDYENAYNYSSKLIDLEENSGNYYWRGFISDKLNNLKQAEKDLRKAIELSPKVIDPYKILADVLYKAEKYDQALNICNKGLKIDKKNKSLLNTRSFVYKEKGEYSRAINDVSKILLHNSDDVEALFNRGILYQQLNQSNNAISDFSEVINLKPGHAKAYYRRAKSNEEITDYSKAAQDYKKYIQLAKNDPTKSEKIRKANKRVFELLREENKPEIVLADSISNEGGTIDIPGNADSLTVAGTVKDESEIVSFKINEEKIELENKDSEKIFNKTLDISNSDDNKIHLKAKDIYENTRDIAYKIKRNETQPPEIKLSNPYASDDGLIYLQNERSKLYVEGEIKDESLIESIKIGDKTASYTSDVKNPSFSATIDIENQDKFTVKAVDTKGNIREKEFSLNREGANISSDNPMGKTWVVFIENSNYKTFASLDGPVKDVSTIKSALSSYRVHNFIHKKNMTKKEMKRFFSDELRNLVKTNQVNSLLLWYAGHGKSINETGYWVPTDAKRDDEHTFFNISNLKASLKAYSDAITHTLVVTDACESGPSFYQAMRSIHKKRDCSNWEDTRAKSAQVLSSSGNEIAVDQSQFTESFANTLVNNPNTCLPIEDIVSKITRSVTKAGREEPQFGKIDGLEDEGGTFFFISENE